MPPESGMCFGDKCSALLIPTKLESSRLPFLFQTLKSLEPRVHDHVYMIMSSNDPKPEMHLLERHSLHLIEVQPTDLPGKLQAAIERLPTCVEFLAWIGDDDNLIPEGLSKLLSAIRANDGYAAVFGNCAYIDSKGRRLGLSSVGQLAQKLLTTGPMLIPQPSTIFRKSIVIDCGGISSEFSRVFDYFLLLQVNKKGVIKYIDTLASEWRWHKESGTTSRRLESSIQAWVARTKVRGILHNLLAIPIDLVVVLATSAAGLMLNFLVRRQDA